MIRRLRDATGWAFPAVVLTGDTSPETEREIQGTGCRHLAKPVKPDHLLVLAGQLAGHDRRGGGGEPPPAPPAWSAPRPVPQGATEPATPTVFVVEDDREVREPVCALLERAGHRVEAFATAEALLGASVPAGGDAR